MADFFRRDHTMLSRIWAVAVIAFVGLLSISPVSEAQSSQGYSYCKPYGGNQYSECFPAPMRYASRPNKDAPFSDYIYSSRSAAARSVAAGVYSDMVLQDPRGAVCNRGILWDNLPDTCSGIGPGWCNTMVTPGDGPDNMWLYSPVYLWGIGDPYDRGTDRHIVCSNDGGGVTGKVMCPTGYVAFIDYYKDSKGVSQGTHFCRKSFDDNSPFKLNDPYNEGPDGPSGADKSADCNACGINPVNLSTGSKYDTSVDFQNHSPFPIQIIRYYSSTTSGWHFNYNRRVQDFSMENGNVAYVSILREDGTQLRYKSTNANPQVNASQWTWSAVQHENSKTIVSVFKVIRPANGSVQGYELKNLRNETEHFNGEGLMVSLEGQNGFGLTFEYDTLKRLKKVKDDFGRWVSFSYPALYQGSSSWSNGQGAGSYEDTFNYWANEKSLDMSERGLPSSITDGSVTIQYSYLFEQTNISANNRAVLNEVTWQDGTKKKYFYGEPNSGGWKAALTGIEGEDGQRFASYTYSYGMVSSSTHGQGLRRIGYGGYGKYVQDAYDNYFYYRTDSAYVAGKPTGFRKPCPKEICSGEGARYQNITFDEYGNSLTLTDFKGNIQTKTWDGPRNLMLSLEEASGTPLARTTSWTWHATERLPLTMTEPVEVNGIQGARLTTYTYDQNYHLIGRSVSNSFNTEVHAESWTYNADGLLQSHTDARGKTESWTYDIQGNVLTHTNALGHVTSWSNYTPNGLAQRQVDANGLVTETTYDTRERILQVRTGSATTHWETTSFTWLPIGKLDTITRADGVRYKMLYDSAHDLVEVQEWDANQVYLGKMVITLDLMGRETAREVFDEQGQKIAKSTQSWNILSQVTTMVGAQNQTSSLQYDDNGNLKTTTDPLDHTQTQNWDALNRPTTMVNALNLTVEQTYGVQDEVLTQIDAKGAVTTTTYNAFGDITSLASPDRGTSHYTVNALGLRTQSIDARGVKTTMTYDDLHRPLTINWNGATADASVNTASRFANYTWDDCTNGKGRLCSKTDHTGTTAYTYDLWGRLSGQSFSPLGGLAHLSFGYGYNAQGQRTSMRYPSGKILLMSYGANGRVVSYQWEGSTLLNNVVYQPMGGALKAWSWGASGLGANASQVHLTFDQDGRLMHSSDIEEIDWVYDLDSRLVGKAHLGNVDLDQLYEYDAEDRLISADSTLWGGAMSYGYDNNGNRTQKLWQNDGFQFNYGLNNNRLNSVEPILNGSPTLALSVSLDAMGNIIQDAQGQSYTYDLAGRMVQSQSSAGTTQYTVNSDGLRVRKVNTGSTSANEWFVYDEQRRLIGVYDLSGNQLAIHEELVYRPESWALAFTIRGQTAGVSGNSGIAYPILSDNIGTPRVVLDPTNGHKRWTWEAKEAFGMEAPVENPQNDGNFVFNARFPGQWFDEETGLFQNGYRDYNPQTGRYMQSDPIGLNAGWNTYGYVGGNPQNSMDPLGLNMFDVHVKISNTISRIDEKIVEAFSGYNMPEIPSGVANFSGGVGDYASFGLTSYIRNLHDTQNFVDINCDSYNYGSYAGFGMSLFSGAGALTSLNMGIKYTAQMTGRKLYHYSSAEAAEKIAREGIKSSKGGLYGKGIYVTPFGPRVGKVLGAKEVGGVTVITSPANKVVPTFVPGNFLVRP